MLVLHPPAELGLPCFGCRFLLPLKEEQRVTYVTKLLEWTECHSLQPTFQFNGKKTPAKEDMTKIENAVLRFHFEDTKA